MRGISIASAVALAGCITTIALGQQGGAQGPYQRDSQGPIQEVEQRINTYLNDQEIKNILTPGEFSEWTLKMKAGQVVIAAARSDAFDPAIEIVDENKKVLASNDDRYPGEQGPLVLWRCERDGTYGLHVRCFHDKSGGPFFIRFKTYDTVDLLTDGKVEKDLDSRNPFLLRVPMKAGEVKDIVADFGGEHKYMNFRFSTVIFPDGLPERSPSLSEPISPAIRALIAPVAGDYYLLENPFGRGSGMAGMGKVRVGTRTIVPTKLGVEGDGYTAKAPTDLPALWEIPVKKGDLLEASAIDLHLDCKFILSEAPDFSKYDVSKPDTNPFYPQLKVRAPGQDPPFDVLPARARDGRVTVFRANRDAKLWLATDGNGPDGKQYTLRVRPAAAVFDEDKSHSGRLKIGNTDYWAFDAKPGDVMSLTSSASTFAQQVIVRDPDLNEVRRATADPDQTTDTWRMIVEKPGRYLVAMSSLGDGGGGEYALSRRVFHAKEFSAGSPAQADISTGDVQVWKFTAKPNEPLLIHWDSTNWQYGVAIYDEKGQPADFQRQEVDEHNRFGILKVTQPHTYVIVLTGDRGKATYSIELGPIPGYKGAASGAANAHKES